MCLYIYVCVCVGVCQLEATVVEALQELNQHKDNENQTKQIVHGKYPCTALVFACFRCSDDTS